MVWGWYVVMRTTLPFTVPYGKAGSFLTRTWTLSYPQGWDVKYLTSTALCHRYMPAYSPRWQEFTSFFAVKTVACSMSQSPTVYMPWMVSVMYHGRCTRQCPGRNFTLWASNQRTGTFFTGSWPWKHGTLCLGWRRCSDHRLCRRLRYRSVGCLRGMITGSWWGCGTSQATPTLPTETDICYL